MVAITAEQGNWSHSFEVGQSGVKDAVSVYLATLVVPANKTVEAIYIYNGTRIFFNSLMMDELEGIGESRMKELLKNRLITLYVDGFEDKYLLYSSICRIEIIISHII